MAHDVGCAGGRSNLKGMTNNPLPDIGFTLQQKEYLQGYFAGLACGGMMPFVGQMPDGRITNMPAPGIANRAAEPESPAEKTAYGTPVSDLCEQELWKLEQYGLDIWDKLIAHANEDKFPDKADTFRAPHRDFLKAMAEHDGTDQYLKELISVDVRTELDKFLWGRESIDFLNESPGVKFAPAEFVSFLKKLQPRLYSIASSLKAHPEQVHLGPKATTGCFSERKNRAVIFSTKMNWRRCGGRAS
jgi:FAD binding domain